MITSLAYFGVGSPAWRQWETFGPEVLGAEMAGKGPDGAIRLRLDDVAHRLVIHPADQDRVEYIGWSVVDEGGALDVVEKLRDYGIAAVKGTQEEADLRAAAGFYSFVDPTGFRHELAWGLMHATAPFRPGRAISGFRTGEQGLGHVVLGVADLDKADRFYGDVMGFELSDTVKEGPIEAHFFHVNGRHHSLAVARPPGAKPAFLHLMLEVQAMDDVGLAMDLCLERGIPITRTLGRHSNDHVISFYMHTPSNFRIEYGWGGMEVADQWVPRRYDRASIWGHRNQHPELSPFLFVNTTV